MTPLATSLKRIWPATSRVPHRTGWGTAGSKTTVTAGIMLAGWAFEKLLELVELAQRTAPTVIVVALNIFR